MNSLKIEKIESDAVLSICAEILVDAYNSEPWIEETIKNWVGNLEQVDDITLIGVRV